MLDTNDAAHRAPTDEILSPSEFLDRAETYFKEVVNEAMSALIVWRFNCPPNFLQNGWEMSGVERPTRDTVTVFGRRNSRSRPEPEMHRFLTAIADDSGFEILLDTRPFETVSAKFVGPAPLRFGDLEKGMLYSFARDLRKLAYI